MSIDLMVFVDQITKQSKDQSWHDKTNREKLESILEQFEQLELSVDTRNVARMKVELTALAAKCFVAWRSIQMRWCKANAGFIMGMFVGNVIGSLLFHYALK